MKTILLFISALFFCETAFAQFTFFSDTDREEIIHFSKNSVFLNKAAKKKLDSVLIIIKEHHHPLCKIVVSGYGNSCITCQQTSWDRVYSVIKYLRQQGIDSSRFIFYYAQEEKSPLVVMIRGLWDGEDGSAFVEAPVPCYSYHRLTKRRCRQAPH